MDIQHGTSHTGQSAESSKCASMHSLRARARAETRRSQKRADRERSNRARPSREPSARTPRRGERGARDALAERVAARERGRQHEQLVAAGRAPWRRRASHATACGAFIGRARAHQAWQVSICPSLLNSRHALGFMPHQRRPRGRSAARERSARILRIFSNCCRSNCCSRKDSSDRLKRTTSTLLSPRHGRDAPRVRLLSPTSQLTLRRSRSRPRTCGPSRSPRPSPRRLDPGWRLISCRSRIGSCRPRARGATGTGG